MCLVSASKAKVPTHLCLKYHGCKKERRCNTTVARHIGGHEPTFTESARFTNKQTKKEQNKTTYGQKKRPKEKRQKTTKCKNYIGTYQ